MDWSRTVAGRRSLAALAALVLTAAAFVWNPRDTRALAQGVSGAVVLFGSSSMIGIFGHVIAKDFEQLGFDVTRRGLVSAGLARPDFHDVPQSLGKVSLGPRSTSVLLYIGVNDAKALWLRPEERTARDNSPWLSWSDERWESIYAARMVNLINAQCERGAKHTFVLSPADVKRERLQVRLERIRTVQQRAARASKCGCYIPTTGDNGRFEINGRSLRSRDGVHMSRIGALTVWERIRTRVLAVLGSSDPSHAYGACRDESDSGGGGVASSSDEVSSAARAHSN